MQIKRIRPGLYIITTAETTWTVEDREQPEGYGGGWAWYATSENGDALDPLPTLRAVKAALR